MSEHNQSEKQEQCRFCGDDRVVERHHVVPRRYDGSDSSDNLVVVCPTCHQILEKLYDRDFYRQIGARVEDRDAYETGVKEALNLLFEIRVKERKSIEVARHTVINELLNGYHACNACNHPTESKEECDVCSVKNPTEIEVNL